MRKILRDAICIQPISGHDDVQAQHITFTFGARLVDYVPLFQDKIVDRGSGETAFGSRLHT
jgi:hypothetical protein